MILLDFRSHMRPDPVVIRPKSGMQLSRDDRERLLFPGDLVLGSKVLCS